MTLNEILWNNRGQVLTPELIVGIQANFDESLATGEPPIPVPGDWVEAPNLRPSNKKLVLDQHERVASWVAARADCGVHAWAGYVCLGLEDEAGDLIAGVVLESYNGRNANIHIAGIGRNWMSINMLLTFFNYCFRHLKLTRLTGLVPASNHAALNFDYHVGFKHEATLKGAAKDGDLEVLVMRREDCRFMRYLDNTGDSRTV